MKSIMTTFILLTASALSFADVDLDTSTATSINHKEMNNKSGTHIYSGKTKEARKIINHRNTAGQTDHENNPVRIDEQRMEEYPLNRGTLPARGK